MAEQCQEMATSTLIEVQRQGHALDKVEHGLDTVSCYFQTLCSRFLVHFRAGGLKRNQFAITGR